MRKWERGERKDARYGAEGVRKERSRGVESECVMGSVKERREEEEP